MIVLKLYTALANIMETQTSLTTRVASAAKLAWMPRLRREDKTHGPSVPAWESHLLHYLVKIHVYDMMKNPDGRVGYPN